MGSENVVELFDRTADIERLAKLSPEDYEAVRKAEAERLGVRRSWLDAAVESRRAKPDKEGKKDDKPKERQLQVSLDLLVNKLRRYADDNDSAFGYANGGWYIYRGGYWRMFTLIDDEDMARILADMTPDLGLVYGKDASIIDRHLRSSMHFKINPLDFDREPFVAVRNGTIDITTGELLDHNAAHMTTRFIDIDYIRSAKCPEWEMMLSRMLEDFEFDIRPAVIGFLQEWVGVALVGGSTDRTPRALRKALFLYGPPNAGKSTVFDVVRELLGTDRVVSSKVTEINTRFGLESFLSASAWITEEVDDVRKEAGSSRVKCLITGEPVAASRRYKPDATLRFNGPVGWAGNTAPNFTESSNAVYDRIVVVPMERIFSPAEAKEKFGRLKPVEWLYEQGEFPGIFNWALDGYYRLLRRGQFEEIKALRSAREAWREQNDVVYDFVRNYTEVREGVHNEPDTLAWSVLAYAKLTKNDRWPELQTIKMALNAAVAENYPAVKRGRPRKEDGGRPKVFRGLALTDAGIAYFKQAKEQWPAPTEKLHVNEPDLLLGPA